jgi:UDP-glucose 4-epimerase
MYILVTGGAGYIGSHTLVKLIESGYLPLVFDNLSNSSIASIKRVENITGKSVNFVKGDITNEKDLLHLFDSFKIDAVIHFAGLKAVGESVLQPIKYYENNVLGSIRLFKVMTMYGIKKIVFSSSAAVYGEQKILPIKESMPIETPTNPYGISKLMVENLLGSIQSHDKSWSVINLRYFNPVGAHKSGLIGENPSGLPNNLMPFVTQTAIGKFPEVLIFGNNYNTHDGTGVRDFIHVVDLAAAHIKALKKTMTAKGIWTLNIGTGIGYSALDIVKEVEKVSNRRVPYKIVGRRSGDISECYSDPSLAKEVLGWEAEKGLTEMCEDAWRWQSMNPNGY